MKLLGTLKVSDTFKTDIVLDDDGTPYDLTGATVISQVENEDESFVFPLTVTVTNAALGEITVTGNTTTWPLGILKWDVRFTQGGFSWAMPTYAIEVEEKVS